MNKLNYKRTYLPESDSEDELPPGWEERATDDGLVCYTNQQNKTSQWVHPRTGRVKRVSRDLPIDWEKTINSTTNREIFLNRVTNQTTLIDPRLAFATEEPPQSVEQVRQRYDASSTALQVLHGKNLSGRLAIITGCNTGIGLETARSLVLHGCDVIFACRNRQATDAAIGIITSERPATRSRCRFMELDLGSFRSVLKFVKAVKRTVIHINFLILNAGVFALPYSMTEDGIETTFQVSHLAHFYLTCQLDSLFDHNSRIVVLSSESHRFANLSPDNLNQQHLSPPKKKYWSMMAYNNAKLCNILFAEELAHRWKHRGVSVFAVHPGNMVSTNLQRNWWFYRLLFAVVRPFTKSLQQAAATTIFCATAKELTGLSGFYFNNCFFCDPSKLSKDGELRQQLWRISEQMIQSILNAHAEIHKFSQNTY